MYRPLGAFRFGLACLVMLQHFQHLLPNAQRQMFSRMGFGAIAVCVFFAVSGFVVAEANGVFYQARPGAFLLNRFLRVAPAYWAAFLLSALVQSALYAAHLLVLWDYQLAGPPWGGRVLAGGFLALLPGFRPQFLGQDFEFLPFVWSLRMEVAFYLACGAVLACARRWGDWLVSAGFVLGLAASGAFLTLGRPGLLSTAPMFLLGVALYGAEQRWCLRNGLALCAAGLLALLGFASWRQHGAPLLWAQLVLLCALLCLFAWLARQRVDGRGRLLDRNLGDLSYSLYLNHYTVGLALCGVFAARGLALYAAGCAGGLVLAFAMARLVEAPLVRLRNRVRARAL